MNRETVRALIDDVRLGKVSVDQAVSQLRNFPFEDLGFARIDHHRAVRRGRPEVIYCPGKRPEHIAQIAARLRAANPVVLATRADMTAFEAVRSACGDDARFDEVSRLITIGTPAAGLFSGRITVVAAGTADLPVAEEAAGTAYAYGHCVERVYDVGVAGLHRLLGAMDKIQWAQVVIVVAGMDGALPSVVGGLVEQPVIAVPTSVGYGASFGGVAALLSMLNSCASGVAVVNIDNGFGAARVADSILQVAFQAQSVSSQAARPAPKEEVKGDMNDAHSLC